MAMTCQEIIVLLCKAMGPVTLKSIKHELRQQYAGEWSEEQVREVITGLCEQGAIEEYEQVPEEVPDDKRAWW